MRRQERRRQQLRPVQRQTFLRTLLWAAGGLASAVALVLILLAALGVFSGQESPPTPTYALTSAQMAQLASTGHSLGSSDAPVTMLEFGDFQCPYCEQFWSGPLKEIKKEFVDTGKARLVYRHLIIVGPESTLAAQAAECAAEQGQFFPYHDLLFQNQGPENAGYLTQAKLTGFAGQLGLDRERFAVCLAGGKYQETVARSTAEGRAIGVRGTPTVLVNGRLVQNILDLDELRSIILDELKRRP